MSRMNAVVGTVLMAVSLSLAAVPVSIVDFAFSPDTVRINAGDSVIWTNNGTFLHTSTSGVNGVPDGLWNSGDMSHGVTFVHAFPDNGTFDYYCAHHYLSGMAGAVLVGMSGVNETPDVAGGLAALSSYPNPFSSATTLRLAPARTARGDLRVFDASGKLVRVLGLAQGASVVWDGRDSRGKPTGPGVYFCRYGSATQAVTRLP